MSEDDAAYAALLVELFSDSTTASDRDARVHSWIKQQYGFPASEEQKSESISRSPSPSPSSSFGAHRVHNVASAALSRDALFAAPIGNCEKQIQELRSIVQQMAHCMAQSTSQSSPRSSEDKPLPALPPATPLHQYISSPLKSSHTSLTRVSCLPSVVLSPDQSTGVQEIPFSLSPLPFIDGCAHERDQYSPPSHTQCQEQDGQLHVLDYRDYVPRSPTVSNYSFANSRKTSFTTTSTSSPVSPADAIFLTSQCSRENVTLPYSSVDDQAIWEPTTSPTREHAPQPSPFSKSIPPADKPPTFLISRSCPESRGAVDNASKNPCALRFSEHSQSRWSVTTTASAFVEPPHPESNTTLHLNSRKRSNTSTTPPKRKHFMNLMRFSKNRTTDVSSTKETVNLAYDNDEQGATRNGDSKGKDKKKKLSLSSLRASLSLSLSLSSLGSPRSPISSPTDEVPPLPNTPFRISPSALPRKVSSPEVILTGENLPSLPSIQSMPWSAPVSPISRSSFQKSSSDDLTALASASCVCLARTDASPSASRISPFSSLRKQISLPSVDRTEMIFKTTARAAAANIQHLVPPTTIHAARASAEFTIPTKLASVIAAQPSHPPVLSGLSQPGASAMSSPALAKAPRSIIAVQGECFPRLSFASSPPSLSTEPYIY